MGTWCDNGAMKWDEKWLPDNLMEKKQDSVYFLTFVTNANPFVTVYL